LLLPLGILLLGVALASLWSARIAARRAEARVAEQVHNVAESLSNSVYPLTSATLEQVKQLSGADYLLITPQSRLTTFPVHVAPVTIPSETDFKGVEGESLGPVVKVGNATYRCRRVLLKKHPDGSGVLYIYYPETRLNDSIRDAQRPSLIAFFLGVGAILLTLGISHRLVSRIRDIEARTRQIASGDFSPMTLPKTDDELRDLGASVNDMAGQLAALQSQVRSQERKGLTAQLATGLAHQLRNGVTGAKLALQVYRTETTDDGEAIDVTLRQLSLMEANLRRFIDLGRPIPSTMQRCSLIDILNEVVALYRPRCKHANISLHWEPPAEQITLTADSAQLGDIFGNLMGNAIEACGAEGEVRLSVVATGSEIVVEIADTGPGPSADVSGRLFEPFVTGKPEGIGLGLAVAQHAAQQHGGSIDWYRKENHTYFRVQIPRG
jgi:signal transduction histidine kinase